MQQDAEVHHQIQSLAEAIFVTKSDPSVSQMGREVVAEGI
jgi:hypothetical protein